MPVEARIRRLLLCSSAKDKLAPLRVRLVTAGIEVDCAVHVDEARALLWKQHYDAVAVDLLLSDRDGISFALELRREHPWLSVVVISTTQHIRSQDREPHWLSQCTDHARLVFALKQAGQRAAGRTPKILHLEEDDQLASLVRNTIGKQTQLFRARTAREARIALELQDYDLALVRSQTLQSGAVGDADTGGSAPVYIEAGDGDPVLTILNKLRSRPLVHQPAYC